MKQQYTLPQDLLESIAKGCLKAQDLVSFVMRKGFFRPSGKPLEAVCLQDLMQSGYKIKKAQIDTVKGILHLELA